MNLKDFRCLSWFASGLIYSIAAVLLMAFIVKPTIEASSNMLHAQHVDVQVLPEFQKPANWELHIPHVMVSISSKVENRLPFEYQELLSMKLPVDEQYFIMGRVLEIDRGKHQVEWSIEGDSVYWVPTNPIKPGAEYIFTIEYHYSPTMLIDNMMVLDYSYCFCFPIDSLSLHLYMPANTDQHEIYPGQYSTNVINNGVHVYSYIYGELKANQSIELTAKYLDYGTQNVFFSREGFTNYYETVDYDFMAIIIFTLMLVVIGLFVMSLTGKKHTDICNEKNASATTEDYLSDEERQKRKDLRKLLIDGKINEDTYRELL